jgi:hypothetical protein
VLCVVQVEVSATVPSLARESPTECGVCESDLETSMMGPKSTSVVEQWGNITEIYPISYRHLSR